jgi:hypothetical protein
MQSAIREKTGHKPNLSKMAEVLYEDKVKGDSVISLAVDDMIAALAVQDPKFVIKASEPAEPQGNASADPAPKVESKKKSTGRSRGQQIRSRRDANRAPKPTFSVLPGDYVILKEIQDWVDEQRKPLPANFTPEHLRKPEKGVVEYWCPNGNWKRLPAVEFAKLQQEGKLPNAEPSEAEIRKMADELRKLSFLSPKKGEKRKCEVCHLELRKEHSPERAQIHMLLKGYMVLPWIDHSLRPNQMELRFQSSHLACSLWEDQIADIMLDTSASLEEVIVSKVAEVWSEAKRKQPKITEDEILLSLQNVLKYITGEKE